MSRLSTLAPVDMTPEQRKVYDEIASNREVGPDGTLGGPFDPWVRSPELAEKAVGFGGFLRFRTTLPRRIVELAILITGRLWTAQFEWYAHEPMALKAGLDPGVVEAIKARHRPNFKKEDERAAYEFITELQRDHRVSEPVYNDAVAHFGETGVAELIAVSGYYVMVSMILNAFEVEVPEGVEPPLRA